DWSSDVCSSDLEKQGHRQRQRQIDICCLLRAAILETGSASISFLCFTKTQKGSGYCLRNSGRKTGIPFSWNCAKTLPGATTQASDSKLLYGAGLGPAFGEAFTVFRPRWLHTFSQRDRSMLRMG